MDKLGTYYSDTKDVHIYNICKRNKVTREDAEDICQNAFLKAHSRWENYDENKGTIGAWFFRILLGAISDFRKNAEKQVDLVEEDYKQEQEYDIENFLSVAVTNPLHLQVLQQYRAGVPIEEISSSLGYKESSVRSIISRFKQFCNNVENINGWNS